MNTINHRGLSLLTSTATTALLDTCIDQLTLLNPHNLNHRLDLKYRTLSEKFDLRNSYRWEEKSMFQCVIALVRQLLELLKDSKRGYDEVVDFLGGCLKERRDEEELLASAERKSRKLKVLMCRVEEEKGRLMRLLVGCTERFGKLRDEYEEMLVIFEIEKKYIGDWENALSDSNKSRLEFTEKILQNTVKDYFQKTDQEIRVNLEINKYLQCQRNDSQNKIVRWMAQYDDEIEQRDQHIFILKQKRQHQLAKKQYTLNLFNVHKKQIDTYIEVRKMRRLKMEEEVRNERAAGKIQAWWRGVMVRRGLGPYRQKKVKNKSKKETKH